MYVLFMQENSKWRQHYLNSLYEYMQTCNKELAFLSEEQDKIKKQDWSDRMTDPSDTRRQYEVKHPSIPTTPPSIHPNIRSSIHPSKHPSTYIHTDIDCLYMCIQDFAQVYNGAISND